MITLALSKGRIFEETMPLLAAAGIEVTEDPEKSRKLILETTRPDVRVVLVRASDVPTYVQYGGADLGVTGLDVLLENGNQGMYQPLDLRIAACRLSVAVRADYDYASAVRQGSRLRVATKYVGLSRDFFASKGVHVDLIKLYGSMELAPLTGLADAIVDLVSTGNTLKANHLVEVERIMDISARLVVNQAALKLKREPIRRIIDAFASAIPSANPARPMTLKAAPARLSTTSASFDAEFKARLHWSADADAAIEKVVADILADVQKRGDEAVLEYTRRFDGLGAATVPELELTQADFKEAFDSLPEDQRDALQAAADRVRSYHEAQKKASGESWSYRDADGTLLGQKVTPLDRVGIYVPGGKAAYPSSLLMNAIPAHVAGVSEIIMVVPTPVKGSVATGGAGGQSSTKGERNVLVLAAAYVAGVTRASPSAAPRPWPRWPTAPPPSPRSTRSPAPATPTWPPPSAACSAPWAST
jgi:ATP phosphoribosyltransferase